MKNPVEQFVELHQDSREVSNYTHLARTAGVSTQVVTKTVKGVYPRIPPSIMKVLRDYNPNTPEDTINFWYDQWIEQEVRYLYEEIGYGKYEAIPLFEDPTNFKSFVEWRETFNKSLMGFCDKWKLPHATMIGWEKGNGIELPAVLRDRLRVLLPVTGKTTEEIEEYIRVLTYLPRRA